MQAEPNGVISQAFISPLGAQPARRLLPAEPNADHRLFYLDYEGPVSGGRGTVSRWAAGLFDWIEDGPDRVTVRVNSDRLAGLVTLRAESDRRWACNITSD